MSFKASRVLTLPGVSSTGTKHDLLLEYSDSDSDYRFTVVGANGKRHASTLIGDQWAAIVADFLTEGLAK